MRLQKYLSQCGVASRRAAEDMIAKGRIKVNGVVVDTPGYIVQPGDVVEADGIQARPSATTRTVMLNKPAGVVTTMNDPQGRTTVADIVSVKERLYPVGRLDYQTEGLLLLTNDGELANALMHPSREVDKLYHVVVKGDISQEAIQQMEHGMVLGDGHQTAPAKVSRAPRLAAGDALRITVHEGHNRLIRRMCAAVGLVVTHLRREAIGPLALQGLRSGQYRDLTERELQLLRQACGLEKAT